MIYLQIAQFNFRKSLAYPYDTFATVFRKVISLSMTIIFWYALANTSDIKFDTRSLISYFLIAGAVSELTLLTNLKYGRAIQKLIKNGEINNYLLKPVDTLFFMYFAFMGNATIDVLIGIISITAGILISPPPSLLAYPLFIVNLLIAALLSYSINVLLGIIGFLTPESGSIRNVFNHFIRVFSGLLVPISFFPDALRNFILLTPLPFMVYAPAQSLTASNIGQTELRNIAMGLAWGVSLYLITSLLWKRLYKRYEAIGI